MTPRQPLYITSLLLLAACQPVAPPISQEDRAAIQQGSDDFVRHLLAGRADSIGLLYAEDAVIMPANMPEIRGRAAIQSFFAAFPPVAEAALLNDTVVGFGDLAYVKGRYRSRLAAAGAALDSGKFLEIRRREPDGSWTFIVEIVNSSVALPPPRD